MYGSERKRQQATLLSHGAGVVLRRAPAAKRQASVLETPSLDQLEANAALLKRQAEIEQELQLARDLQQGLLLEAVPYLPGWELSAVSLPARDLGGDLYDFLRLEQGQHGIMIGDVSGKGLSAALRMAVARTVFRHQARRGTSPASTLADVNEGVLSEIPYGMVTMLYAQLDPSQGVLELANAGHNYPLLVNGHVQEIEISGLPLGVDSDSDYSQLRVVLAPADMLVFYTDGVVEATNAQGEMFGYERLERLVSEFKQLRPRALVAKLLAQLRAWIDGTAQDDDITLVVLRRRLSRLHDEIWEVAVDVLGPERAQQLWNDLQIEMELTAEEWANLLPDAVTRAKQLFGRGQARELQQQFRLVIDEYKEQPT
jgi:sigma-B regulation protein RsbU (phosphoserine phosphatase)